MVAGGTRRLSVNAAQAMATAKRAEVNELRAIKGSGMISGDD